MSKDEARDDEVSARLDRISRGTDVDGLVNTLDVEILGAGMEPKGCVNSLMLLASVLISGVAPALLPALLKLILEAAAELFASLSHDEDVTSAAAAAAMRFFQGNV